ncbi:MAG: protein kinase [Myxococcota bacterium]
MTVDASALTFDAAPLAVGRDFVVYGATLDGRKVAVKAGLPQRERAPAEVALRREHDALVAVARNSPKNAPAVVPATLGLTTLGDGRLALGTAFVEGLPLSQVIERALVRRRYQGARRWNAATRELFAALAGALGAVHRAGLVHNDLKPENILVRDSGHGLDVVLLDFALAAPDGRGGPGGTVAYAAPERLEGRPGTIASDVWALAAILYELLAGTRPYPTDLPADAIEARKHPVDRLPRESAARAWMTLPPEVQATLVAGLAADPKRRPRSVRALVKRLDVRARASAATASVAPARPSTPASTSTWRLVVGGLLVLIGGALGVGLGLVATHHATAAAPAPMCLDGHGVDACRAALTNTTFAKVLGVPVAVWAAALHAVLLAAAGVRLLAKRGNLALLALVVILLAGTTAYLVIGLVIVDVRCTLCLALHAAALGVGAGGLLVVRDIRPALREPRAWAGVFGALAGWVALALLIATIVRPRPAQAAERDPTATAERASTRAAQCPAAVTHTFYDLPPDDASVVLADPPDAAPGSPGSAASPRPVLVEVLDLECDACRAAHATLAPLYRELAQTQRAGLRLVLLTDRPTLVARAAPAALICAERHGGALAALDFVDWELRASPGYYTPEDRRRWLATRLDATAARCLDAELAAGAHGTLAAHASWVADMKRLAAARPECDDAAARNAWWCWVGTPSFGVFRADERPPRGRPRPRTGWPLDRIGGRPERRPRAVPGVTPMTPTTSAGTPTTATRLRQLALLLLLLLLGVGGLGWVASLSEPCGDGLCAAGESCPRDCAHLVAAAPAALALGPGPRLDPAAPPPTPAPAPAPSPSPSTSTSTNSPPPTRSAPTPAPAPAPPEDLGRCAEPSFKAMALSVVKSCERACKKDQSPLVALTEPELEGLFARPDDAGVATHFAVFGCNRYTADGQACRGFDSSVADPALCPPGNDACVRYATALSRELRAFLDRNRDAHTVLLLGTASATGNDVGAMSDANAKLAEERALAVGEVVHGWRRDVGGKARDMRVYSVVLDNTRTDWWRSPAFRAVLEAQVEKLRKLGTSAAERGFEPLAPDAANRSVMVVAIRCPLDAADLSP